MEDVYPTVVDDDLEFFFGQRRSPPSRLEEERKESYEVGISLHPVHSQLMITCFWE